MPLGRKESLAAGEWKLERRKQIIRKLRAVIHLVMGNVFWLEDQESEQLTDNVQKNIEILTRKRVEKSSLTLKEKSILSKQAEERTDEEKQILSRAISGLKCFRRYPPHVKTQLAAVTYFLYAGMNRVILRQDHLPLSMYFLLSGECNISIKRYDKYLNEWVESESGTVGPGSMFGEVALLHGIPRLATITTASPCELLMIEKEDFDLILRETVWNDWEEILNILNKYNYFKTWDPMVKRKCCILSKTKSFEAEEIVIEDDDGLDKYVYFVTKGSCYMVEYLPLRVFSVKGIKKYALHVPNPPETNIVDEKKKSLRSVVIYSKNGTEHRATRDSRNIPNIFTSKKTDYKIETHFIRLCDLNEGACFNIGENLRNKQIVSKVRCTCLLVPRWWIFKHNKDNIWSRVQQFLNLNIPSQKQVFHRFLEEEKFIKYRKSLIEDLLAEHKVSNTNSSHNVPYSIRLKEKYWNNN